MRRVIEGDCRAVLADMPADSIDAVLTDPPYHLIAGGIGLRSMMVNGRGNALTSSARGGFMNAKWDGGDVAFDPATWRAVLRVLRPGGYLAAFSGSRTQHRMVCAIEDAGFEIRDSISYLHDGGLSGPLLWAHAQGFPKSLNVSAALTSLPWCACGGSDVASATAKISPPSELDAATLAGFGPHTELIRSLVSERKVSVCENCGRPMMPAWVRSGMGTALKPSVELICLARKPLSERTVAANVLRHGCGALNIDGCRIGTDNISQHGRNGDNFGFTSPEEAGRSWTGRWPANLCHDGSDEVEAAFAAAGERSSGGVTHQPKRSGFSGFDPERDSGTYVQRDADTGSASRFFYSAKADKADRAGTSHPTTKPTELLLWLTRLICPPGGTVLDPFAGSGTTGVACVRQGFNAVLIEQSAEYVEMIKSRLRQEGVRGMDADPTQPQPEHVPQLSLGLF